jgi:hypothetical protein
MRRFLLTSCLILAATPALAQSQRAAISRPVATMAAGCMSDCLAGAGPAAGAAPYAARICQLRCEAGARFNAAAVQPPQAARRGRPPLQLVGAGAPAPMAAAPVSVIVTSRAPSRGFGLVAGERDRLYAFREAEDQCRVNGAGCRVLMEAPAACAAVAHATKRHQYALVMTTDSSTWTVTSMSGGFGPTQAVAEAEAMADCRSRDPGATCRIAASRCGASRS